MNSPVLDNPILNNPVLNSPIMGYAHHRIIPDESGRPLDYEFLEVNSTFEKLTGLSRETLLNRTVREVLPGIDAGQFDWITFYGEVALTGGEREFEQYSEPLGRWYRVHVYSTEYLHFTTIFIDVTESRKEHEELEGFFTVNLDLLCIADLEGNFLKTNEAWSRILGYGTKDLNNRKFLEVVHPDDVQATLDAMSRLGAGEEVLNFTNRYRCRDGSYRFIEWRSKPKGRLIYAAARDITDRKMAEEARIRLVEAATDLQFCTPENVDFAGIAETARLLSGASYGALNIFAPHGGSFVTTAVAGVSHHIRQAMEVLGFPLEGRQWSHDPLREAALGESRTTFFPSLTSLATGGFTASLARRITRTFGLGEVVITRIIAPSGVLGDFTLLFHRDEHLRNQELLETFAGIVGITLTRIRAEERNIKLIREKETLLKEVQHRIKNNMNTMTSLLSLQAEQVRGTRVAEDVLNDMRGRFRSMEVLYDRLYRSDAGESGSVAEYLRALVHQVVSLFPGAAWVTVEVRSRRDCDLDAKRLSTVGLIVNELVTNAMKYAFREDPRESGAAADIPKLTVTMECRSGTVEIRVEDTGPGLPSSFDAANPSGFGIVMVQAMTDQLEGTIRFEGSRRAADHGTRVVLNFPGDYSR